MKKQMNKRELATQIWTMANNLRGSIEASDYKDFILGFIFYKYLSDTQYEFLIKQGYEEQDIKDLNDENYEEVKYIQNNIGYFIKPDDLFKNWVELGSNFTVDNVINALNAFQRNISQNPQDQKVFSDILDPLTSRIRELGSSASQRTKQVRDLVDLIQDIPTVNDDYDVLGYIYEYLISKFAANAGKSSGEFYTPSSASEYMSNVIAHYLKNRETIEIYDPTSGSGSLLLHIGDLFETYHESNDNVKFYTQEYKNATEILTRMNLLMHNVKPANIVSRRGDSLKADFPYFDESDPEGTYEPVFVDAVVSNPPYSQIWDPTDMDQDPRFSEYGLAPRGKADFAFLLHGLYHVKTDGIMAIVLPHGVLFRNEEKEIRKKLIEKNNIEAIVGLPANMFFGTGIATTILFLKKARSESNVLFIDASKYFIKNGNKNDLRAMDIKRLIDVTIQRIEVEKYSRLVDIEEIILNDYNLNISRYIDSNPKPDTWDINAVVNGGIPKNELNYFNKFFNTMPDLFMDLFEEIDNKYVILKSSNVNKVLEKSQSVINFKENYKDKFIDFDKYLYELLIDNIETVKPFYAKKDAVKELFNRFKEISLIDKYEAYDHLDKVWLNVSNDIQMIQETTLLEAATAIDPNIVIRKKDGEEKRVKDGDKGRIFSFEFIQDQLLREKRDIISTFENRKIEIESELLEIIESLSEEDGEYSVLNDNNDSFLITNTEKEFKNLFASIDIPELDLIKEFKKLENKKTTRTKFMNDHPEIDWYSMDLKKDNTPSAKGLRNYEEHLQLTYEFDEDSFGAKLSRATALLSERKDINSKIKILSNDLYKLTIETIKNLTEEQVVELLYRKWIHPLMLNIYNLANLKFKLLEKKLTALNEKYNTTMYEIEMEIKKTNTELVQMMNQLNGSESDLHGIRNLQELLSGDNYDK